MKSKDSPLKSKNLIDWIIWNGYVPHGLPLRNGNVFNKVGSTEVKTLAQLQQEFEDHTKEFES